MYKLSALIPVSGILVFSLILVACNNNGGGGPVNGDASRPFASNSSLLPTPVIPIDENSTGNTNVVVTGYTVAGLTGTVSDATISVTDGEGTLLFFDSGDERANYSVTLPTGTSYPVMITATNGVDLVTGLPPVISMVSVIESEAVATANINPFTTLIVKTAQAMPGGVNPANLDLANQYVATSLNFGMDVARMPDFITTPANEQNIAFVIKTGRALTETIHRSVVELSLAGIFMNENELLDRLAADMVDGKPDGIGADGADPFLAAVMNVVSAQVLVESISNNLQVDGVPVVAGMDSAIKTIFPAALSGTADVVVSGEMLAHLKLVIHAAQSVTGSEDQDLSAIRSAIAGLDVDMLPADIEPLLPAYASTAFDPAINSLISTSESAVYQTVLSAFSADHKHQLIALAWYPSEGVDGYIVHAGPSPFAATAKVSVIPSPTVELDVQTDLGLNPGDNVCFRIKAYNASGVSDFSGAVCTII